MVQFLTFLFGGPNHYKGPDMVTLHKNMPVKQEHFDITWEHMESAYLVFKIPKDLISQMKDLVYGLQGEIVQIKQWWLSLMDILSYPLELYSFQYIFQ